MIKTIIIASLAVSMIFATPIRSTVGSEDEDILEFSVSNRGHEFAMPTRNILPERLIDEVPIDTNSSQERVSAVHSEDDIFYKFASLPLFPVEKSLKSLNGF
ncbi:unnamed protein product [Caenorhabditis bovis]|uniref:Uncharacterized protein n=1 Tax=Caenorhabditis bovis TaxID=2654633 RepID=A0A8S1EGG9_9PELO|nr:unnamed protein product [Caenorhabditis bovis]